MGKVSLIIARATGIAASWWGKVLLGALALLILVVLASLGKALLKPPTPPTGSWSPASASKIEDKLPTEERHPQRVQVKRKADAIEAFKLETTPQAQNPDEEVLASVEVQSSEHDTTAVVFLNVTTGKSSVVIRKEPLPWFQLTNKGSVGLYYGYAYRPGEPVAPQMVVQGAWQFAQVKSVGVELMGQVNSHGEAFAGVGAKYRW